MLFKSQTWRPIAVVLSVLNWAGAGYAVGAAEPWHAAAHVALAVAFGYWARSLQRRGDPTRDAADARIDVLEQEVSSLRQGLNEAHERLDFAERLLVQAREARQMSGGG